MQHLPKLVKAKTKVKKTKVSQKNLGIKLNNTMYNYVKLSEGLQDKTKNVLISIVVCQLFLVEVNFG